MIKLITLMLALCLLTGCGAAGSDQGTRPAPTETAAVAASPYAIEELVIGTTGLIETATRDEYNYDMLASAVSELPLVGQDMTGSYYPLITDYATEDAKTWTFTIREGLTWSDGVPVTAEDLLFTFQYADGQGSANFTDQPGDEGKITRAKYEAYALSDDGRSLTLTLAQANVRELSNMTSVRIMPKHIYEGKEQLTEAELRVSCGPYKLESFNKAAGTLTFVPDPYYPECPRVGRIVYRLFSNEDTMYLALEKGDLQMVWTYSGGVPTAYQEVLSGSENVELLRVAAANAPAVLAFNNAAGPFTEEALRQAVVLALDYTLFRDYVGSSAAQIPNRSFVPPTTVGYRETAALAQDQAAAAGLLEQAGCTKNADGRYERDGKPLAFTLTYRADKTGHAGAAELIKTQLEAFGIGVTLEPLDADSYNAKTSNKFSGNNVTMEAALYGYTAAGMGMMNGLGTIYVDGSHGVQGGCQVFDEEFVRLLEDMKASCTPEAYQEAAGAMQEYYAAHLPLTALYWDAMTYAYSAKLDGITADAVFGLNHVRNWYTVTEK